MELRVLKYFLEIAKDENLTRAAERLYITQPTLTRQLHQLEEELGKKLYTRTNYKIKLTEEGKLLKERAQEFLDLEEKTKADIQGNSENISGVIYIGAGETVGIRFVGKILKKLITQYPKINYRMISADSEGVIEKLDRGLLDFAVFVGKNKIEKYNYITLPDSDRWGVIIQKDSPLAEKEFITPEDLLKIPLLTSYQAIKENEFEGWLGYPQEKLNIIGFHNLVYNASVMARDGLGAVLTIENIIKEDELKFLPLKPELRARLTFAWRKDAMFSKAAKKFLEYVLNS
ncbi:MAG: LysR family transcriptional regulator [Synergistaceae bacterium]|nr:LysR family transcriptional regulator [Synergistaceae bacterium]